MPRTLVEPAPQDAPEAFATAAPPAAPAEESEGATGVPVHRLARWALALVGVAGFVWAWSVAPLLALAGLGVGLVLVGGLLVSAPWRARRQMSRRPARRARQSRPRSGGWRQRMGCAVSHRGARGGTTRVGPGRPGGSTGAPRGGTRLVTPGRPGGSTGPRGGTVGAGSRAQRTGLPGRQGGGRGGGQLPGSTGDPTSTTGRGRAGSGGALSGLKQRLTGRRSGQAGQGGNSSPGMVPSSSRDASQTRPPGSRRGLFSSGRRSPRTPASASPASSSIGGRPPTSGSPAGVRVGTGLPTGKAGRRAATSSRPSTPSAGVRSGGGTPGVRPGVTGRGTAPTGSRTSATPRRLRQPSTWLGGRGPSSRQGRQRQRGRTTPGGKSAGERPWWRPAPSYGGAVDNRRPKRPVPADPAKQSRREWWFGRPDPSGARGRGDRFKDSPDTPSADRSPKRRRQGPDHTQQQEGKKQRAPKRAVIGTAGLGEERETLAWLGHSDLTAEPHPPSTSHRGWWDSTDESAGFHTGPATNNQGVQPMSTADNPPDVATIETARETYLANTEDATAQSSAWLTEAQIARDEADGLAARNDTGEHNGEIGRLHTHADGCHANGVRRAATAAAWRQEAANALHRITAMTRG